MGTQTSNDIYLEASTVTWGSGECHRLTTVTGLAGGQYYNLSTPTQDYYMWIDEDNLSVDPAPAGRLPLEVDISAGYTIADINAAIKTSLQANNLFVVTIESAGTILVEAQDVGAPLSAYADVDTTFTDAQLTAGKGGDLGATKEGIDVSQTVSVFDVKKNQTGEILQDQIITGTEASASMTLLELTPAKLALIFGEGFGNKHTPAGGTEIVGFGSSKNFQSSFSYTGKLILHPVRLPAADRSQDFVFHATVPMPESINYDGTDTKGLSLSFNALNDSSKDSKISLFAIGDWKQDLS